MTLNKYTNFFNCMISMINPAIIEHRYLLVLQSELPCILPIKSRARGIGHMGWALMMATAFQMPHWHIDM